MKIVFLLTFAAIFNSAYTSTIKHASSDKTEIFDETTTNVDCTTIASKSEEKSTTSDLFTNVENTKQIETTTSGEIKLLDVQTEAKSANKIETTTNNNILTTDTLNIPENVTNKINLSVENVEITTYSSTNIPNTENISDEKLLDVNEETEEIVTSSPKAKDDLQSTTKYEPTTNSITAFTSSPNIQRINETNHVNITDVKHLDVDVFTNSPETKNNSPNIDSEIVEKTHEKLLIVNSSTTENYSSEDQTEKTTNIQSTTEIDDSTTENSPVTTTEEAAELLTTMEYSVSTEATVEEVSSESSRSQKLISREGENTSEISTEITTEISSLESSSSSATTTEDPSEDAHIKSEDVYGTAAVETTTNADDTTGDDKEPTGSPEGSSISTTEKITNPTTTTTTEPTTTPDPCRKEIPDLNVVVIPSPFSLYLDWSSNPLPTTCNYEYKISWDIKNHHKKISSTETTNKTECEIENLNACEDYTVNIAILYSNEMIKDTNKNATTSEAMEPIANITSAVALTYDSKDIKNVTVSWELPIHVQKCLKKYIIQIYKDGFHQNSFDIEKNSTTFYNVSYCTNNTYLVLSHSENIGAAPVGTTYLDPQLNDAPIFNKAKTEILNDSVITKWNFGTFICRPEEFKMECHTKTEEYNITGEFNVQQGDLTATIEDVIPYTNYTCCGIISNMKGDSRCYEPVVLLTKPKPPEKPQNLTITQTDYNLEIEWSAPEIWNGIPKGYRLSVEFVKFNYEMPEGCEEEKPFTPFSKIFDDISINNYKFVIIEPASLYRISVQAQSSGGWGEMETIENDIEESAPEAPQKLAVKVYPSTTKEYSAYFYLTWQPPCKLHGQSLGFNIKILEQKDNNTVPTLTEVNLPVDKEAYKSSSNLQPEYKYTVQIMARNNDHDGKIAEILFDAPAGIPKKPNVINLKKPDTSTVEEPWNSAVVYISKSIFDESQGEIKYVAVIVAEPHCEEGQKDDYYDGNNWPKVSSDNSSCTNESKAYEATQPRWNPFFTARDSEKEYQYTLGTNTSCTELDCNKPLKSGTTYSVKLRGFTSRGYHDTEFLCITTDVFSDVPVGLIVGLIVGILAITFIIAAVLFYTRGRLNFKNWPRMESANQISPAPLPVPIKKFGSHYEKMIDSPGKIKNEFQLLSTISSDVTLSTKTALLPMNKKKNRYINILPYDQTRVQLIDTTDNSSDYINASYIKGYSGSDEYIATQGPTEATCPAFWQMIIEKNIKLIVMLTQFVESGKDKCYKYFPDLNEEYDFLNDTQVHCLEEDLTNVYNKRVFEVKKGDITKKVTHMQFNLWPDFGVPDEVIHMLDFCEIIKEIKLKKPSMIVMHCSAGVGRTGTLIAVDILLQNVRDKRKVDIFGTVLNLRKQRMNMVQSEKQYEFLYKCLNYVITNKLSTASSKFILNQISESNML